MQRNDYNRKWNYIKPSTFKDYLAHWLSALGQNLRNIKFRRNFFHFLSVLEMYLLKNRLITEDREIELILEYNWQFNDIF